MRFKTHVLKESKRMLKSYSFPFELQQFRQCIFSFRCKFCLTGSINTGTMAESVADTAIHVFCIGDHVQAKSLVL